ncbi:putative UDP-glucosyl transferase 88A1 [Tripterygium wilfordii]|uniref:Glycosyltransferase n=3 Tax=Tripterygium wilfordii TaxID=458696 RepID=A0A7J7CAK3_TRIWF|nr:putative UDP-glucosyl transferase 88A1 [Tripterygium wilfordii]
MEAIVLYPSPGIGHLISMVELGKLILSHYPSFTIKILLINVPFNTGSTADYIASVSAAVPSIAFRQLPTISLPRDPASYTSIGVMASELLRFNTPHVHDELLSISQICNVNALIIDLFCAPVLGIAAKLGIPAYHFFTSGASCLALFFQLPVIHQNTIKSFKDLEGTTVDLSCLPPVPLSHMPTPTLERNTFEYESFIDCTAHLKKSAGIIVNTFESLEPKAVKALEDGVCVPDGPTPSIFCVGPLISTNHQTGGGHDKMRECLTWLNTQPNRSVVFLCFGSRGVFSKEQLGEIAIGLERSGQRFLWVVRDPPSDVKRESILVQSLEPDLNSLLPDGFLERTKERGLVMGSWAPQLQVLNHESVGGFVTHCGWNSALESICAGVPMVAWPLYAEQKINKILLVEELKLALPMNESESGLVSAIEVEKRVRDLMESDQGKSMKERMLVKMKEALKAMGDGGSSRVALAELVESWKQG